MYAKNDVLHVEWVLWLVHLDWATRRRIFANEIYYYDEWRATRMTRGEILVAVDACCASR